LFQTAGKIISHGRQVFLKISREALEIFVMIRGVARGSWPKEAPSPKPHDGSAFDGAEISRNDGRSASEIRRNSAAGDHNQSQRTASGTGSAGAVQDELKNILQTNAPAQSKTQSRILGISTVQSHYRPVIS